MTVKRPFAEEMRERAREDEEAIAGEEGGRGRRWCRGPRL